MSYDTLFITDLHGNLEALRRAVQRAMQVTESCVTSSREGTSRPNLVTVRLRDGEYVHTRHATADVADDFRARLRDGRRYRSVDQHGKRPVTHAIDLDTGAVMGLGEDDTALQESLSRFSVSARSSSPMSCYRCCTASGAMAWVCSQCSATTTSEELESLLLEEDQTRPSVVHPRANPPPGTRAGAGIRLRPQQAIPLPPLGAERGTNRTRPCRLTEGLDTSGLVTLDPSAAVRGQPEPGSAGARRYARGQPVGSLASGGEAVRHSSIRPHP